MLGLEEAIAPNLGPILPHLIFARWGYRNNLSKNQMTKSNKTDILKSACYSNRNYFILSQTVDDLFIDTYLWYWNAVNWNR